MSVKSELAALTTLTGVNYPIWADKITAYLKSKGLFCIVSGALKAPASTEDTYKTWMAKDEQAQGIIQMKISPAIRTKLNTQFLLRSSGTAGVAVTTSVSAVGQHIAGATHQSTTPTSNHYWLYLQTTYGQPGIMAIHGHYRDMLAIHIAEGQNPVKGLDAIQAAYDKLVQHEAAPDNKTLAMIMVVALPKSFDALAPYIMTKTSMKEVKSDEVRHQAITLFETRNQRTHRPKQAHKATAVKPAFKAKTSFTAQTQPAPPQQAQRDGNPRQRQPRSQKKGKGKPNKGKGRAHSAHVADTNAEEDDDNNFASVAVEVSPPARLTLAERLSDQVEPVPERKAFITDEDRECAHKHYVGLGLKPEGKFFLHQARTYAIARTQQLARLEAFHAESRPSDPLVKTNVTAAIASTSNNTPCERAVRVQQAIKDAKLLHIGTAGTLPVSGKTGTYRDKRKPVATQIALWNDTERIYVCRVPGCAAEVYKGKCCGCQQPYLSSPNLRSDRMRKRMSRLDSNGWRGRSKPAPIRCTVEGCNGVLGKSNVCPVCVEDYNLNSNKQCAKDTYEAMLGKRDSKPPASPV
jgi:hypothetical protein